MQDADRKTPAILRRLSQAHMSLTATDYRFIIVFNGALITLGNVGILNTNITKAALPIGGKGGSLFFHDPLVRLPAHSVLHSSLVN